ncbi:hypothetical protein OAL23_00270 [bacterium]|nr:hypothetical protein [bacterium]
MADRFGRHPAEVGIVIADDLIEPGTVKAGLVNMETWVGATMPPKRFAASSQ